MSEFATTQAILIGIENYIAEIALPLDGPANDVLALTKWLREKNVPKDNIHVFLSPLESNYEVYDEIARLIGCDPQKATDHAIYDFFSGALADLEGSYLFIYWSGHALIPESEREERRLICSDATDNDFRNHNLDKLLETLRTDKYKIIDQLWIIDACSTFYNTSLPNHQYQQGMRRECQQYVMLSTAKGQAAKINKATRSSYFTLELLDELNSLQPSTNWPSDLQNLQNNLVSRFDQLRQGISITQTPSYLYWRGGSIERNSLGIVPKPNLDSLRIADIVVSQSESPRPLLDIKLFNPSNTVVFLTEITAIVISRSPLTGLVNPSAEYDLLIDTQKNILKVSHEIPPNKTERILIRLGAAKHNLSCAFSLALEFTYNEGQVLRSPPFSVVFIEENSYSRNNEPIRLQGLEPINVESDPDLTRSCSTSLWVWAEIDAEIYVDDLLKMKIDHRSGFAYSRAEVQLKFSSTMTIKAQGLERTVRFWDFYIPGTSKCRVHIGTYSFSGTHSSEYYVQITQDEKKKAMGNQSDLPVLHNDLLRDPSYSARAWAAERLGYIGEQATIQLLVKAMHEDSEPYVQAIAASALGRIGEPAVLPELEKAYTVYGRKESYGYMFESACKSLKSVEEGRVQGQKMPNNSAGAD